MLNKGYILMLEGDEHDRELSKNYFDTLQIPFEQLKFSNEIIPFLKDKHTSGELPALLLFALNSVPNNGLEVLKEVRRTEIFKHIPVIILGEHTQEELIKECYANGASTFINKPLGSALTDLSIKTFIQYWFEVAELPKTEKKYTTRKV